MINISEKELHSVLKKKFESLVGKSCKRVEVIRDIEGVNYKSQVEILKSLIKELDYEAMREIEKSIKNFSNGTRISINLERPNSE